MLRLERCGSSGLLTTRSGVGLCRLYAPLHTYRDASATSRVAAALSPAGVTDSASDLSTRAWTRRSTTVSGTWWRSAAAAAGAVQQSSMTNRTSWIIARSTAEPGRLDRLDALVMRNVLTHKGLGRGHENALNGGLSYGKASATLVSVLCATSNPNLGSSTRPGGTGQLSGAWMKTTGPCGVPNPVSTRPRIHCRSAGQALARSGC